MALPTMDQATSKTPPTMLVSFADFLDEKSLLGQYSRFMQLGSEMGLAFRHVSLAGAVHGGSARPFLDKWSAIIADADLIILRARNLPQGETPGAAERLIDRIKAGACALVFVNPDRLSEINAILAHFEMAASPLRLANVSMRTPHPRLVQFRRDEGCFRHMELFAGLDEVLVDGPNVIWYYGHAMPLLSASDNEIVVDEGDLPTRWKGRESACMTGWCGDRGQVVIAIAGNLLGNPYHGPLGDYWPGIEANERFARNLLRYFKKATGGARPEALLDGNNLCDRIEVSLGDFVFGVLRLSARGGDWWTDLVPTSIRITCAQRQEEECNRIPRQAYLNLIDLKAIMEKNWQLFEPHFVAAQVKKKKDALDWIDILNSKYRRMAAHPLKRHVAGFIYDSEDMAFLCKYQDLALRLCAVSGAGGQP